MVADARCPTCGGVKRPNGTTRGEPPCRCAKVIPFTGITKLDMPPDQILETAKGRLEGVIVVGYGTDGEEYFASSYADGGTVNWLLDRCKKKLLGNPESYS